MQRVILVVSPDTEFLQQLRSHLEEGGRYQVTVALSAHEALNLANSNFFEVAILDGELDDIPVAAFTRDLAALQSEIKILMFPPDNNPHHPVLDGIVVNGFLSKPFSGQEIGKSLSGLFSDQPKTSNVQVKVVDDLVKQWLQIPDTGGRKAEQILATTTAQTVLIIIKDQLIASAGSIDDGMVTNVSGFLSRYWKEEENSELARFLKLGGDGSERFLYATRLVSNVVLVLVYPMKATIQLVRRELNIVKDDFQLHYPTTEELRQDIAKHTLDEINARNKTLEKTDSNSTTISQHELDVLKLVQQENIAQAASTVSQAELEARKLFEQESLKSKPAAASGISQAEIDALKALTLEPQQSAVSAASQAELEARKLFEQESLKPKPVTAGGISQAEIDVLKALTFEPQQPAAGAVSQAELDARRLFEQESLKPKLQSDSISQAEIDALKAIDIEPEHIAPKALTQTELDARKLFEQESLKSKPMVTINDVTQDELDVLKTLEQEPPRTTAAGVAQYELDALQLFHQESLKPTTVTAPSISEQELSELSKMLDQMPAPDPQSETENTNNPAAPVEEKKLPEWLNELENSEQTVVSAVPPPLPTTEPTTPPFVGIDESIITTPEPAAVLVSSEINSVNDSVSASEPLPEIDFKLPWEVEETSAEALSQVLPEQSVETVLESVTPSTPAVDQQVTAPPVEVQEQVPPSFAEVLNSVAPQIESSPIVSTVEPVVDPVVETTAEPAAPAVPNLKDFRFTYTCVLLPGDRNQFLARNLSEKLGRIMPEIHDDQGWRMTSITIRPQYLLWSVAVPMGVCPNQIMSEVRNLTSNSIYANFPEIAKTSNDFWSSKFLAVSGIEPPPANLIFDFVSQAWKIPETETP